MLERAATGDRHNFGRFVELIDNTWFKKPRPLLWEHIFLDPRSDLRRLMRTRNLDEYLPSLRVDPEIEHEHEGKVDRLILDREFDFRSDDPLLLASGYGYCMALAMAFGIIDLHHENVWFGFQGGEFVTAIVDIESIFNSIHFPQEACLIPSEKKLWNVAGFRDMKTLFHVPGFLATVLEHYYQTMHKILEIELDIAACFNRLFANGNVTSRVILRSTGLYKAAQHDDRWISEKSFIDAEVAQLKRSEPDVPYFFRYINSSEVRYFSEPGVSRVVSINKDLEKKCRFFFTEPSNQFFSDDRRKRLLSLTPLQFIKQILKMTMHGKEFSDSSKSVVISCISGNIEVAFEKTTYRGYSNDF